MFVMSPATSLRSVATKVSIVQEAPLARVTQPCAIAAFANAVSSVMVSSITLRVRFGVSPELLFMMVIVKGAGLPAITVLFGAVQTLVTESAG